MCGTSGRRHASVRTRACAAPPPVGRPGGGRGSNVPNGPDSPRRLLRTAPPTHHPTPPACQLCIIIKLKVARDSPLCKGAQSAGGWSHGKENIRPVPAPYPLLMHVSTLGIYVMHPAMGPWPLGVPPRLLNPVLASLAVCTLFARRRVYSVLYYVCMCMYVHKYAEQRRSGCIMACLIRRWGPVTARHERSCPQQQGAVTWAVHGDGRRREAGGLGHVGNPRRDSALTWVTAWTVREKGG